MKKRKKIPHKTNKMCFIMKQYDECNAKGITKEFRTILEKFDENLANKIDIKNDSKRTADFGFKI